VTAFRDQLALDVSAVFLNEDEFAREITIDDVTLSAVLDDDLTLERPSRVVEWESEGIHTRRRVLHLTAGLIPTPAEGARLIIVGLGETTVREQSWYVERVSEAEGMLHLTITQNRA